jgi:hypothetical protein
MNKTTWIALAVFLGLGAWVLFGERGEVREKGVAPPVSEMVGMKADEVTRVELQHGGQTIALAKAGKEWRIEKPIQARADNAQVQQVLDSLLKGTLDHVVEEKITDYKEYGLDKPSFQVTLADAKGHQKVLQLGAKDPRGFSLYARTADRPELFLVNSYSVEELQKKKPEDLRDKTALVVDPAAVNKLSIQASTGALKVEKQGDKWRMSGVQAARGQPAAVPSPLPADPDAVQGVLDQLKGLRIEKFESAGGDMARYGLASPRLTVTVSGTGGEKGLRLGKQTADGKNLFAARLGEQEVFQLPKITYEDLSKKPGDLRDKTLLSFKRADATGITITTPDHTLELTRSGEEWKVVKPAIPRVKEDRLSSLLFTMEVVKGSHVVAEKPADLAKYGLDRPQVRVQVALPKGPQELLIGKKAGAAEYYARSNSQDAVFTVPDFTVTDLKVKPDELKAEAEKKKA